MSGINPEISGRGPGVSGIIPDWDVRTTATRGAIEAMSPILIDDNQKNGKNLQEENDSIDNILEDIMRTYLANSMKFDYDNGIALMFP